MNFLRPGHWFTIVYVFLKKKIPGCTWHTCNVNGPLSFYLVTHWHGHAQTRHILVFLNFLQVQWTNPGILMWCVSLVDWFCISNPLKRDTKNQFLSLSIKKVLGLISLQGFHKNMLRIFFSFKLNCLPGKTWITKIKAVRWKNEYITPAFTPTDTT